MVENLPANAGDTGSSPGLGGSHMPQCNWAHEPQLLSLCVWSLCSATRRGHDSERPAHRDEEWPPVATTRESPCTERKTQHNQKLKKKKNVPHCIQIKTANHNDHLYTLPVVFAFLWESTNDYLTLLLSVVIDFLSVPPKSGL